MGLLSFILPLLVIGGLWYWAISASRWRLRDRPGTAATQARDGLPAPLSQSRPQGFGTRRVPIMPEPLPTSSHVLGPELHERGEPEKRPFGEDVVNPESRTIPAEFHGVWKTPNGGDTVIFEAERYQYMDNLGMQPVVAVRRISHGEIAIVSQQVDKGKWLYCLQSYGLLDDGNALTDLENMDMKWVRA